tara:strand:- start:165 stop:407 length:243 start_codon:yes stop_codon:yes gene_type:complete
MTNLEIREVLIRGDTGGCDIADTILLGEKSSCFECPFPSGCTTKKSKAYIDQVAVAFRHVKPEVTASLFGIHIKTIKRRC